LPHQPERRRDVGSSREDHVMMIQLTDEQWANIQRDELPVRVIDHARSAAFEPQWAHVYERFKSTTSYTSRCSSYSVPLPTRSYSCL
jgi:hypothetical protein